MTTMPRFQSLVALEGGHVESAAQFSRKQIDELLELADLLMTRDRQGQDTDVLARRVMVPLFFESSTRTFSSFCAAMAKLGGHVVYLPLESSSMTKGETLEDTARAVDSYADVVVMRHPDAQAFKRVTSVTRHPVVNAGNGIGEHPTQSLLDVFTMVAELGTVDGLTIALVGDLKHGRTVHSLAKLLTNFAVKHLYFVAPPQLAMPDDVIEFVRSRNLSVSSSSSLTDEILSSVDVLYVTRVQKERFQSSADYESVKGHYVVTKALMDKAKARMVVMHPLPRVDEISTEVDDDPRAAYFRQMRYGLFLRMALLVAVLGKTASVC